VIEQVNLSDDVATRFASMVSAQDRQQRAVSAAGQTDAPPLLPDAVQSLAGVLSPPMDEELNVDQSQWSGVSATKVDISPRSQPIPLPPEADAQAAAPGLRIAHVQVVKLYSFDLIESKSPVQPRDHARSSSRLPHNGREYEYRMKSAHVQ
jgi:hypothetical protein